MTTHLSLQRMLLPTAQVSSLTTGSITLPGARGAFTQPTDYQSITTLSLSGSSTQQIANIPQTFHHLQVRGHVGVTALNSLVVQFNGDTNSNYMRQAGGSNESTSTNASTSTATSNFLIMNSSGIFSDAQNFCDFILDIFNYTDTNWHKSVYCVAGQFNETDSQARYEIGRGSYQVTTAINSIEFSNVDFRSGSYVALYGMGIK